MNYQKVLLLILVTFFFKNLYSDTDIPKLIFPSKNDFIKITDFHLQFEVKSDIKIENFKNNLLVCIFFNPETAKGISVGKTYSADESKTNLTPQKLEIKSDKIYEHIILFSKESLEKFEELKEGFQTKEAYLVVLKKKGNDGSLEVIYNIKIFIMEASPKSSGTFSVRNEINFQIDTNNMDTLYKTKYKDQIKEYIDNCKKIRSNDVLYSQHYNNCDLTLLKIISVEVSLREGSIKRITVHTKKGEEEMIFAGDIRVSLTDFKEEMIEKKYVRVYRINWTNELQRAEFLYISDVLQFIPSNDNDYLPSDQDLTLYPDIPKIIYGNDNSLTNYLDGAIYTDITKLTGANQSNNYFLEFSSKLFLNLKGFRGLFTSFFNYLRPMARFSNSVDNSENVAENGIEFTKLIAHPKEMFGLETSLYTYSRYDTYRFELLTSGHWGSTAYKPASSDEKQISFLMLKLGTLLKISVSPYFKTAFNYKLNFVQTYDDSPKKPTYFKFFSFNMPEPVQEINFTTYYFPDEYSGSGFFLNIGGYFYWDAKRDSYLNFGYKLDINSLFNKNVKDKKADVLNMINK